MDLMLENLKKELMNVNNELKQSQEQHIKIKQENSEKMQETELKLTEKEEEILDANKSLSEKSTCLTTAEQDLKLIRQEKLNLEEECAKGKIEKVVENIPKKDVNLSVKKQGKKGAKEKQRGEDKFLK